MKYAASFKATEFFRHDGAGRYPINTYWRAYQRGNFDYWRCGFIGSHILAALQGRPDIKVVVFDNLSGGSREHVRPGWS